MGQPIGPAQIAMRARYDFEQARRRSFFGEAAAFLHRRPNLLISYADVERHLPFEGQHYRGVETVPVSAVRGSVDRYEDFDRNFLPRQTHTRARWESVDRANLSGIDLPPIQVYKVGEVYFVKDGNHRVSVARQQGVEFIDAEVIEMQTAVALPAGADARELIRLAEYGRFLTSTNLKRLRPDTRIVLTELGGYDRLLEHVSGHRWFLGQEYHRAFSWDEAVQSWHDTVYRPLVDLISSHGIMHAFPRRTEADLYLWIVEHRYYLSLTSGKLVEGDEAIASFHRNQLRLWRRALRIAYELYHQPARVLAFLRHRLRDALRN